MRSPNELFPPDIFGTNYRFYCFIDNIFLGLEDIFFFHSLKFVFYCYNAKYFGSNVFPLPETNIDLVLAAVHGSGR